MIIGGTSRREFEQPLFPLDLQTVLPGNSQMGKPNPSATKLKMYLGADDTSISFWLDPGAPRSHSAARTTTIAARIVMKLNRSFFYA